MILSFFKSFFNSTSEKKSEVMDDSVIREIVSSRYPPYDEGFPVVSGKDLLLQHDLLMRKIRYISGTSEEDYEKLFMPLLVRYAEFVQLLPASAKHHHKGAGGLLRHGLEVAYIALENTASVLFAGRENTEFKRVKEPRWRLATFIAALLHDAGKPVSDIEVIDKDGDLIWNPYESTISEWAKTNKLERYYIRWRDQRIHKNHEVFSGLVSNMLIPDACMSYLSEGGPEVIGAMMKSISGMVLPSEEITLHELVSKADQMSTQKDLINYGSVAGVKGTPVERHIVDSMRQLIKNHTHWTVNTDGGRIWVANQGVFIIWNAASKEIKAQLKKNGVPGIPQDADTLAEILVDHGYVEKFIRKDGEEDLYWKAELTIKGMNHSFNTVKLVRPEIILDSLDVYEPFDIKILNIDPDDEEEELEDQSEQSDVEGQGSSELATGAVVDAHDSSEAVVSESVTSSDQASIAVVSMTDVEVEESDAEAVSFSSKVEEGAYEWIVSKGRVGIILEWLLGSLKEGDIPWGESVFIHEGSFAFSSNKKLFEASGFSLKDFKQGLIQKDFAIPNAEKIDSIDHSIYINGTKRRGIVILSSALSDKCFAYLGKDIVAKGKLKDGPPKKTSQAKQVKKEINKPTEKIKVAKVDNAKDIFPQILITSLKNDVVGLEDIWTINDEIYLRYGAAKSLKRIQKQFEDTHANNVILKLFQDNFSKDTYHVENPKTGGEVKAKLYIGIEELSDIKLFLKDMETEV